MYSITVVIVLTCYFTSARQKPIKKGCIFFQHKEQSYKSISMPKGALRTKIHRFFPKLMVVLPNSVKLVLASELHSLNMMVKVHQRHFLLPSVISLVSVRASCFATSKTTNSCDFGSGSVVCFPL